MAEVSWQRFEEGTEADLEAFIHQLEPDRPALIHLKGMQWSPRTGEILASMKPGAPLQHLSIRGAPLRFTGLKALARCPALSSLETLALERCGMCDALAEDFLWAHPFPKLRGLYLCNRDGIETGPLNDLCDLTATVLSLSHRLANLRELDLWNTEVGDWGWESIINSPRLAKLESVYTWNTKLTKEGAQKIKAVLFARRQAPVPPDPPLPTCWLHTDYDERNYSWTDEP